MTRIQCNVLVVVVNTFTADNRVRPDVDRIAAPSLKVSVKSIMSQR
jgi:hypothetical protein